MPYPLPENRLFLVRGNTTLTRHRQRNAYKAVTKIPEKISKHLAGRAWPTH